jgi:hypothetical protein
VNLSVTRRSGLSEPYGTWLRVGHARELAQLDVHHVAEHFLRHVFGDVHDLVLVQERGLDIDLGEFRLAVGAQVFVAEALGDLVVAVEAGHHQQLLEQLRRLRQRKELPGCTRDGTR